MEREFSRRLDALESQLTDEVESLVGRIEEEHEARIAAIGDLARQIQDGVKDLETRAARLDSYRERSERDLRKLMRDQSKEIMGEVSSNAAELRALVEASAAEFKEAKLDRTALSDILKDAAQRVSSNADVAATS